MMICRSIVIGLSKKFLGGVGSINLRVILQIVMKSDIFETLPITLFSLRLQNVYVKTQS